MAEKKTQKKTTQKKTAQKKTTQKKTTTKKSDKIKLTYQPLGFNATKMSFSLKKKNFEGRSEPLIEGLPMKLTVAVGEVIEVTPEQLEALRYEKCVESEEEYKMRKDFIKNMQNQYPQTFSDVEAAEAKKQLISASESQRMIYNDRLIQVD